MPIAVTPKFIYPPRASDSIPREHTSIYAQAGYIAQYKYNDSHCLITVWGDADKTPKITLWNRHGNIMEYKPTPELLDQIHEITKTLNLDTNEWHLLDGGILDRKHRAIKDTLVIWDILVKNSQHLTGTTYAERYETLMDLDYGVSWEYTHHINPNLHAPIDFGIQATPDIIIPKNYIHTKWDSLWDNINIVNAPFTDAKGDIKPVLEGLVFKEIHSPLELGFRADNNSSWMAKSRVKTGRHLY